MGEAHKIDDLTGLFLGDLRDSKTRLVLDCMSDGVIVADRTGAVVLRNEAARRILALEDGEGSPSDWHAGNSVLCLDRETPIVEAELPLATALRGESSSHVEVYLRGDALPDGRYVSINARPLTDGAQIVGAVLALHDVSERVQERHQLHQLALDNERRAGEVNLILDCLSGGVIMADCDCRITKMNRSACNLVGADYSGRMLAELAADYEIMEVDQVTPIPLDQLPLARAIRGEQTTAVEMHMRRHGADAGIIIGASGRPVINGEEIIGGLVAFQDITGKFEAARERNQMQLRMQEMQKLESIGRLAAGVAHEINTPIQYVCNNIDFLKDATAEVIPLVERSAAVIREAMENGFVGENAESVLASIESDDVQFLLGEVSPALEQSLEGSHRVADIVQAMKEFSHPGSGFQDTDINRAIRSSILVARNEWKHAAEVELELDPELPNIVCNPGEFNQVILNMVINAAHAIEEKAGSEAGRIVIATRTEADGIVVSIADNGGGIPEEDQQKIFDPFFTTKGVGKGTGQGLAISHDVVINKHRGRIDVQTAPGQGTTFSIYLPNRPTEDDEAASGS